MLENYKERRFENLSTEIRVRSGDDAGRVEDGPNPQARFIRLKNVYDRRKEEKHISGIEST